jgi:MYXO-CTERM domain-containing protein
MAASEHRVFRAATPELMRVSAFVEERCAQLAVPRDHALRLLLIAEELFLNAVLHGYGGDSDGEVWLTLRRVGPKELELTVEDAAQPFDPFNAAAQPVLESSDPDARPVGGVGLVLVGGLTSRRSYKRKNGRNVVTVAVPLGAAPI